jgi:hypothetical protein
MRWKIVLKLAKSTKHRSMTGLFVNRYSYSFFTTSRASEDCGEFLLDDSDYSASSSPQSYHSALPEGQESIFTFGHRFDGVLSQRWTRLEQAPDPDSRRHSEKATPI